MIGFWFLLGAACGILSVFTQWWTLANLRPEAATLALFLVTGGAVLRWSAVSVLWVAALRDGILPSLSALAGLWLARWATLYFLKENQGVDAQLGA
jgi:hypothetical protein